MSTEPAAGQQAGGLLGFHAPYLEIPSGEYQKTVVETAYDVAIRTMVDFIGEASSFDISPNVAWRLMRPQRDNLMLVDNVDQLGMFRFAVDPVTNPPYLTESMVRNVCTNGFAWETPQSANGLQVELAKMLNEVGWDSSRMTIRIDKTIFGSEGHMSRTVLPTVQAGEGGFYWCILDHTTMNGGLRLSCRGFVFAYDESEALKRATVFDEESIGGYGNPDLDCRIPNVISAFTGYERSLEENAWALVPSETQISKIDDELRRYVSTEPRLTVK